MTYDYIPRHSKKGPTTMQKFADWFTPERRQSIQLLAASFTPLFVLFGFGIDTQWEQWLLILSGVLTFVASVLQLAYLRAGEWGTGWAILRGAIYTLGLSVAPALVVLGFVTSIQAEFFVGGLATVLAVLSNVVAIFTSKQQALDDILIGRLDSLGTTK